MARKRRGVGFQTQSALGAFRRRVDLVMAELQRAGARQVRLVEDEIRALTRKRDALLTEIGAAPRNGGPPRSTRRHADHRVDWDAVFAKLPRSPFQAGVVKKLIPPVSPGTVSLRLSAWVKAKKLRRTGTRRTARYTKIG